MLRRLMMVVAVMVAMLGFSRTARADAKEIKLGTLAPKDSAWGKVFGAWSKAVDEESKGAVKLTWFYNGSKGDEIAMVGKMRSKELDAAAITATGLAQIWPHIGALQMPGLFPTWAKLDAAREKVSPKIDKEFASQGFVILGKGDVGMAHLMSRGVAIRTPDDLKKAHPFYIAGDPIGQKFLETVGVPSPKALTVPAILPAVSSRSVDAEIRDGERTLMVALPARHLAKDIPLGSEPPAYVGISLVDGGQGIAVRTGDAPMGYV